MGLTTAGLSALFEDGNEITAYAAIGDGATSADQVSSARVLVTWGASADQAIEAVNVPLQFDGTPDGVASHLLLFSAPIGGTFYGGVALSGDTVFNADGQFELSEIRMEANDPDAPPGAPEAPFASGTEVGVPTGTSLTTRTSLGSPTGSETYEIVHPVSGDSASLEVDVWENILFTQTFTITTNPTAPFLFRNCRWEVPETVWTVEVDQANGAANQMTPLVVFDHCSFQGEGNSNIGLAANFAWVVSCDIEGMLSPTPASGASDGLQGAAYTVIMDSNIIAGTNEDLEDPHSDGLQCTGTGHSTIYHCWMSAGASEGANAAIRFGTEFGPIDTVQIYYCGLDDGGYALQMRGDAGGGDEDLTNVEIIGNRWTRTAVYGPVDFFNVIDPVWTDNAFFDGEIIPEPSP